MHDSPSVCSMFTSMDADTTDWNPVLTVPLNSMVSESMLPLDAISFSIVSVGSVNPSTFFTSLLKVPAGMLPIALLSPEASKTMAVPLNFHSTPVAAGSMRIAFSELLTTGYIHGLLAAKLGVIMLFPLEMNCFNGNVLLNVHVSESPCLTYLIVVCPFTVLISSSFICSTLPLLQPP